MTAPAAPPLKRRFARRITIPLTAAQSQHIATLIKRDGGGLAEAEVARRIIGGYLPPLRGWSPACRAGEHAKCRGTGCGCGCHGAGSRAGAGPKDGDAETRHRGETPCE